MALRFSALLAALLAISADSSGQTSLGIAYKYSKITQPGWINISPNSINNSNVIVGSYESPDSPHGFILSKGQVTTLDYPGADYTELTGINDNGVIVGHFNTGGADDHGFIDRNGAITTLNFPGEVGFGGTTLSDISDNGQIIGFVWTGSDTRQAFVFTNGQFKTFSVPNSRLTLPNGISSLGVMVGHTILVSSSGSETDAAFTATCH